MANRTRPSRPPGPSKPQPPPQAAAQEHPRASSTAPLDELGISPDSASHPAITPLLEARQHFDAGDYRRARLALATMPEHHPPADLTQASDRLLAAMNFDPASLVFAVFCLALFAFILSLVY